MAPSEDIDYPPEQYFSIMVMCTITFIIPGVIIFAWGLKLGKWESDLEKLAGYLKSYRRIRIHDIARKLGKTEYETEDLIAQCVKQDLVKGYIDRSTGEFFTYESLFEEVKKPNNCPSCGALIDTRLLMGETAVCKYCGNKLTPPPIPRMYPSKTPSYQAQRGFKGPQHAYQQPTQPQQPYIPPPNMMAVKCLNCSKIFDVPQQRGAFIIKCPSCGSQGRM